MLLSFSNFVLLRKSLTNFFEPPVTDPFDLDETLFFVIKKYHFVEINVVVKHPNPRVRVLKTRLVQVNVKVLFQLDLLVTVEFY